MCETPEETKLKEDNKVALKALITIVERSLDAGSDHETTYTVWEGAREIEFEFHKCCGLDSYQIKFMEKMQTQNFTGEDPPEGKMYYDFQVEVCREHTETKKYEEDGQKYDESVPCLKITMAVEFSPEDWVKKYGKSLNIFAWRKNETTGNTESNTKEATPEEVRAEKDLLHS